MILLVALSGMAKAGSLGAFSDASTPVATRLGPAYQNAARLTGVSPFLTPSLWINAKPRMVPVHFVVTAEQLTPQRAGTLADQTLDLMLSLVGHFMGHPQQKTRINGNHY